MFNKTVKEIDFFFGEINRSDTDIKLTLDSVVDKARSTPKKYFKEQIKRLIRDHTNIVLTHESSSPDFETLLDQLIAEGIGMIVISSRTDRNENVRATLDCTLYFKEGMINVRPHWCGYKETRADEIFSTLIIPLIKNGFHAITYLMSDENERELLDVEFEGVVASVMSLSMYASVLNFEERDYWVKALENASNENIRSNILLTENSMERRPAPQDDDIDGEFQAAMDNPKK
jgi:hypothetical protein